MSKLRDGFRVNRVPREAFSMTRRFEELRSSFRVEPAFYQGFRRRDTRDLNAAQRVFLSERSQQLFIQNTWMRMAAIAYHEYLTKDRGAVIVDFTTVRISGPDTYDCNVEYFALKEEKPAKLAGFNIAETLQRMGRYNPEREVLFIVITPDKQMATYQIAQFPRPANSLLMVEALGSV
ncbi:MAG: hypothetical protein HY231_13855 [Acidobacteria bacterium]|nr:hypothetical protein [Acidobacteriota bacterium]